MEILDSFICHKKAAAWRISPFDPGVEAFVHISGCQSELLLVELGPHLWKWRNAFREKEIDPEQRLAMCLR